MNKPITMTIGYSRSTNGAMIEIADSGKMPGRFDEKDTIRVDDGNPVEIGRLGAKLLNANGEKGSKLFMKYVDLVQEFYRDSRRGNGPDVEKGYERIIKEGGKIGIRKSELEEKLGAARSQGYKEAYKNYQTKYSNAFERSDTFHMNHYRQLAIKFGEKAGHGVEKIKRDLEVPALRRACQEEYGRAECEEIWLDQYRSKLLKDPGL